MNEMTERSGGTGQNHLVCRVLTCPITKAEDGKIARDVIRDKWHLVAHDIAAAKFRTKNGITVNGEQVLINKKLSEGDVLEVRIADAPSGKIVPVEGPLDILYEDEDLICLNKPAGLVVHPSHGHFADSLANYLTYYYEKNGEPHEIRTIGRLDKDTSGLIFYGKSRTVCAHMLEQTLKGERVKTYLALAGGAFQNPEGTIDAPISREYEEKIKRVVRSDGDRAVTHYRVLKQYNGYALLQVRIDTGRTHQIRVHMAYIGHPLLGDPIYGSGPDGHLQRAALHAYHTTFRTPFDGIKKELTAPIPEDMWYYVK